MFKPSFQKKCYKVHIILENKIHDNVWIAVHNINVYIYIYILKYLLTRGFVNDHQKTNEFDMK